MYVDKPMIFICIITAVIIVEWLRHKAYQNGRLAGVVEAVRDVSRSCSYHYERENEPLPEVSTRRSSTCRRRSSAGRAPTARSPSI
jgi:hypothetical protein